MVVNAVVVEVSQLKLAILPSIRNIYLVFIIRQKISLDLSEQCDTGDSSPQA